MADIPALTIKTVRALVVDDEIDICRLLSMYLEANGHKVTAVSTIAQALEQASRTSFDLVFLDIRLGTENGLDAIKPLLATSPWVRVVVITAYAAVETAVDAMQRGASDYLPKPFTPAQVKVLVRKVAEEQALAQRAAGLGEAMAAHGPAIDFSTSSAEMREAVELARRISAGTAAILFHGEPGTGKRTLARAIHSWSSRSERPFGIAGCRAPSASHLEAEWFGNTRKLPGGGLTEQPGRVAFCEGGTLLVEDVDQLPASTQPKLLRLIQDRQYERYADFTVHQADVRVIATTTADLDARVAKGEFRADLLHALRGVTIDMPPLRRRIDDIIPLAERYLAFFARQTRPSVLGFDSTAIDAMRRHSWPGNMRELRNLIERAVLVCRGDRIDTADFPPGVLNRVSAVALGDPVPLARVEEMHIRGVLAAAPSIDAAAATLGMDTVTLWRRRKQYGI